MKVRSRDGTSISFDRQGTGPAVVLVGGFPDRSAAALPQSKRRSLEGQSHDVDAAAPAPAPTEFFL